MTSPIGKIVGLFKAGPSGVGGQFQLFDKIDAYLWKMADQCHVVYGIVFNVHDELGSDKDAVIIDCIYDGVCIKDPHAANPGVFVTNYPGNMGGRTWFGYFTPPAYTKYLAPGKHTVQIKIAPRKIILQYFRGRDFSPEAGGVVSDVFTFEVTGTGEEV